MFIGLLLSAQLAHAHPQPLFAASFRGGGSSFRSSSSFSRSTFSGGSSFSRSTIRSTPIRSSGSSAPTRIRSSSFKPEGTIRVRRSTPTTTVSKPKVKPTPSASTPKVTRSSTGNVVITRQKPYVAPPIPSKPLHTESNSIRSYASNSPVYTPRQEVIRETYIDRGSDSFFGNPFFWMYLSESNRNNNTPAPVQVPSPTLPQVVASANSTEQATPVVTVNKEQAAIVQKDDHNPLREFATFSLGAGVMVLIFKWAIK